MSRDRSVDTRRARAPGDFARRYPPLTGLLAAIILALFVLPSALNVTVTNPTQTLEFAPVPPEDDAPPPNDAGNLSSLSLGDSSPPGEGPGAGRGGPERPPDAALPEGLGDNPVTKRCVGDPPRQTEDPMSPPCVAFFDGDNGGETYQGVVRDEVTVLFVADINVGRTTGEGAEDEGAYKGRYFDLGEPPEDDERSVVLRNLRRFQQYFNQRYQTYGRFVRFHVYFSTTESSCYDTAPDGQLCRYSGDPTPETRQADAIGNHDTLRPFAAMTTQLEQGIEGPYVEEMARRGVLSFGSGLNPRPASFYQRFPGLIWSYLPTIEMKARAFSSYVCSKVVGHPVVDSGNPGENGQPRRLGFLRTSDERHPTLIEFSGLVKRQIEECGGEFEAEQTFPQAGRIYQYGGEDPGASYASRNMAEFQQADVTTIVWAGGLETDQSKAAGRIDYEPEWVLAGDGLLESQAGEEQDQDVWRHAWVMTQVPRVGDDADNPCIQALLEADPSTPEDDVFWGCSDASWYPDIRQLFTGIQVAGPRLTVQTIDRGYHAIPSVRSTSPFVPACFYDPGDYTCVKDATAEWWDPQGQVPDRVTTGCWRMVEDGQRYVAGAWPPGNIDAQRQPDDVCNRYNRTAFAT